MPSARPHHCVQTHVGALEACHGRAACMAQPLVQAGHAACGAGVMPCVQVEEQGKVYGGGLGQQSGGLEYKPKNKRQKVMAGPLFLHCAPT